MKNEEMKITIDDLLQLAQRFSLRIVIEKHCVSFYYGCRGVDFYDNVLKKIDIYDIETSIWLMIGGKNEEDQEDTEKDSE